MTFLHGTRETKFIFIIALLLHIGLSFFHGLPPPSIARFIGEILGSAIPVSLAAVIISFVPYFIFRGVAQKYKQYFDYLSFTFLLFTLVIVWGAYYRYSIIGF